MPHAKFVTALDKLIWTIKLAWHNVKIRLMFNMIGLTGLLKFFVLIEDSTEWAIKNRPPTCQLIMSSKNNIHLK